MQNTSFKKKNLTKIYQKTILCTYVNTAVLYRTCSNNIERLEQAIFEV